MLGGYIYLSSRSKLNGAWLLVAGVLITSVSAVGQDGVVLFFGLDHNRVFHLVQMLGVLTLAVGVQKGLVLGTK